MAYVLLLLFILVTAIPWFVRTSPKILHPLNVFVIMQLFLIVPGVLVALTDVSAVFWPIVNAVGKEMNAAISWTLFMLTILNLCVYAGYYYWRSRQPAATHDYARLRIQKFDNYISVGVLMGLMLVSFMMKAWYVGGLEFFLDNLANRVELQRGVGPFLIVEQSARLLGVYIATRIALLRQTPIAWTTLAAIIFISFVVGGLFGARKHALDIIVLVAMTVSFYRPRFLLATPRNIMVLLAGYLVILVILFVGLLYRNSDAQIDLSYILSASLHDIKVMLVTNSYIETYTFITNVYDAGNYYFWSLLGDLKTSLLPVTVFPDKAIGDDGIYVKYAVEGIFLEAQTPVWWVVVDSLPPETLGGAYMNGGPFAVPVYGLVLGIIFAFFLGRAERFPNSPMWVILTFWVFTTFELSNLRLGQLATLALALLAVRLTLKPIEAANISYFRMEDRALAR